MSRQALPHEVAELTARLPAWLPAAVNQAVRFANHGPPWLPYRCRRCPLKAYALLLRLLYWGAKR